MSHAPIQRHALEDAGLEENPKGLWVYFPDHERVLAEKNKLIRELLKEQSEFCQETATLRIMLGKQEEIIAKIKKFDERAFTNQWVIRGVGMPIPQGATQGARCYHAWFVADEIAGKL